MAAKKKSASRRSAAKAKSKKAKRRPKTKKAAARKRPAAKKAAPRRKSPPPPKAAAPPPRPTAPPSTPLSELDQRIAIVRNNLRELMEQASGTSGSASEELLSDRIASQEAELQRLRRERDAVAQNEAR
jgi:hypothetical protein